MSYPQHSTGMSSHPEIIEMRERLERTAASNRAIVVEGLVVLAGVYAAISPWVVHFTGQPTVTVNNLIIGITVALVGLGLTMAPERMFRLAWLLVPLGIWLIITPWVVPAAHGSRAGIIWNNAWVGAITALLGLAAMGLTVGLTRRTHHHR
ncbi:SPW repeat protein [Streptomyces sp. NPDC004069]|uniref:SPW repeat protein n=1 Tax=Streptomyces sp. NPDC052043 TaxID=3365684 RepID=UPI0037D3D9D7